MLDVAGQDASEAFEDVGHSDEARETLEALKVGTLKRQVCLISLLPCIHPFPTLNPDSCRMLTTLCAGW